LRSLEEKEEWREGEAEEVVGAVLPETLAPMNLSLTDFLTAPTSYWLGFQPIAP